MKKLNKKVSLSPIIEKKNGDVWAGGSVDAKNSLKDYMARASKYDKLVELRKERFHCKERIRQIGQEEAKLYGLGEKYGQE